VNVKELYNFTSNGILLGCSNKKRSMSWAGQVACMGKRRGGYSSLMAKTEENRPLERTMHNNKKLTLKLLDNY
jgi:hypothetical protein